MWLECWLWLAPAWGSIPRTLHSRPVVHVYDPSTWWEGAEKPRSRNSWSTQLYLATWWAEASLEPAWARRDIATKTKQTAANKEQETPNNDHDKARKMPRLPRRPEKQAGPGAGASSPGFTQKDGCLAPNLCSYDCCLSLHFLRQYLWSALYTCFQPDSTSQ